MTVELIPVWREELRELWEMQVVAFAELLERYRDYDTSPANEPPERIEERFAQPQTTYYFITADGVRVGAIRIVDFRESGRRKRISPIFIMPEHRRRGYARQAIAQAERLHGADGWMLSTILQEAGNCRLYEKMGYVRTGETERINERMTLVFYNKN